MGARGETEREMKIWRPRQSPTLTTRKQSHTWKNYNKTWNKPLPGGSKPDKPAYCCIPEYAWLRASIPVGLVLEPMPFMLVVTLEVKLERFVKELFPRACIPARPLSEFEEVVPVIVPAKQTEKSNIQINKKYEHKWIVWSNYLKLKIKGVLCNIAIKSICQFVRTD